MLIHPECVDGGISLERVLRSAVIGSWLLFVEEEDGPTIEWMATFLTIASCDNDFLIIDDVRPPFYEEQHCDLDSSNQLPNSAVPEVAFPDFIRPVSCLNRLVQCARWCPTLQRRADLGLEFSWFLERNC